MKSAAVTCLRDRDVLNGFSLEVTSRDASQLAGLAKEIPPGTIVSVPFLATEQHADRVAAARAVREAGYEPMSHIAARRVASEADLADVISELSKQAQVTKLLVVTGDLDTPKGPYPDTAAILRSDILKRYGIKHVSVAGHPEAHPVYDRNALTRALLEKRQILEERQLEWSITTQFTFASEPVLNWIAGVRHEGIQVPIRVGVPGPANVKTLLRFAGVCGVSASAAVLGKYGLSITQLLKSAGPDRLVDDYADTLTGSAYGDIHLHLYPFGGIRKTMEWIRRYREISKTSAAYPSMNMVR